MKIMAITRRRPGATTERIQSLQAAEVSQVWQAIQDGSIREIYFDRERPCVVLILETDSIDAAKARLSTLPMVVEGQIDFDFYTLGPYSQLATLFART
jgi:hypothetical protein